MKRLFLFPAGLAIGLISLFAASTTFAQTLKVKKVDEPKEQLVFNILKLAISKVSPETKFQQLSETVSDARLISETLSSNIDVMWTGTTLDLENKLLPVRIPILKGLLGHRIFIIRSEDKSKFAQINSFDDLKRYNAGQGTMWGDTKVLKEAGIPTITTIKYKNLFPMLEGSRFDYFPRAVHEPWVEVDSRPELNLVVDKNVMLIYPFAMYFFVNEDNAELRDKIYKGFEMAIEDGSFDELFFNNPMIKDVLDKAELTDRRIFRIENPFMHPDTPYDRTEFWLDIDKI